MDRVQQAPQQKAPDKELSDDYIVFIPTSTPEKVALYQHAADTAGWPIQFRPMQDLVDAFHIIDETEGSYEDNANQKLRAAEEIIERFDNGESEKLVNLCEKKWGIKFKADHILFATDDTGIDAAPGIWENVDPTGIPDETLKKINAYLASSAADAHDWQKIKSAIPDVSVLKPIEDYLVSLTTNTNENRWDARQDIWDRMDKTGIPAESIKQIDDYVAGLPTNANAQPRGGAGTELAPVLSALLGAGEYVQRMCNVIMGDSSLNPEITKKNIEFVEHATLKPRFLRKDAPQIDPLSCYTTHFFQTSPEPESGIQSIYHHLQPTNVSQPEHAGKTAADLGWDYIGNYSPKRQLVDQLATKVLHLTPEDKNKYEGRDKTQYKANRRNLTDTMQSFNAIWVDFDSKAVSDAYKNGKPLITHHFGTSPGSKESLHGALKEVETLVQSGDAFVLRPDHGLEDADRFRKYYTLFSMVVAKQLIGRDMNKPIIIQNHDGSWDEAVAMHSHLVKRSMTKDFVFVPHRRGLPEDSKTTLQTNAYFDVVGGSNMEAINDRTAQLLDWHRERYEKREPLNGKPRAYEEGVAAPEDMYKVAVFLSAGNENDDLNKDTFKFCHDLAMKGYGMVTGGGDRYAMGAAYEGYKAGQEDLAKKETHVREGFKTPTWSGGFSTDILLGSETKDGKFAAGFTYKKCCADIYERMADMLQTADTVVVRAGGAGTMEEWMAFLILKQQFPEQMKDKHIIIYDPKVFTTDEKSFYEPILRPVLGKDYDAVVGNLGREEQEKASKELGIYVVRGEEKMAGEKVIDIQLRQLVDRFAEEKYACYLDKTTSSGELDEADQGVPTPPGSFAIRAKRPPLSGSALTQQ